MSIGTILKGVGGLYYVRGDEETHVCRARGVFRQQDQKPLPGDRVEISTQGMIPGEGIITRIFPRKNSFIRPPVANITQAVIVLSVTHPQPDCLLADKLLCMFTKERVSCILCINKSDLGVEKEMEHLLSQYRSAGIPVVTTSTVEKPGTVSLHPFLEGHNTVFAGQSGAGKSSLLNQVLGGYCMETGTLSEKNQRGKHITRHAEFLPAFGGYMVDTPGFSKLDASLLDVDVVKSCYNEFRNHEGFCRFHGCLHRDEPGCRVKQAVERGEISRERYGRYLNIYDAASRALQEKRGY